MPSNNFFDWGSSVNRFVRFDAARAEEVNTALDNVTSGFDDVEVKTNAAIKLPDGESSAALGNAAARQGKVLSFNASTGAAEATVAVGDISDAAANAAAAAADAAAAAASASAAAASATTASTAPVAVPTHAASSKTTPVDADEMPLVDSADSFLLKKLTWANLKTTLQATAANWTISQRSAPATDNDLSFDLAAKNNFTCTPTAGGTLTFTNIASATGQSGSILLVNGSNYAIAKHANTKTDSSFLATVSATGTYRISYYCDGTNVYCSTTGALS